MCETNILLTDPLVAIIVCVFIYKLVKLYLGYKSGQPLN